MDEDIVKYLRDLADNTTKNGWVPVYPPTLRKAADEIEALRQAERNAWKVLAPR
jgi:hypothetical protein